MTIQLSSSAFKDGGVIPKKYTCDLDNLSPPLAWKDLPEKTNSLALIVDDPDAPSGTWVHWVLNNLPSNLIGLPEGVMKTAEVEGIGTQGMNDFRRIGYGGPCPPPGKPHRYFFKLYALDTILDLGSGVTKMELLEEIQGHILDKGELVGLYSR